VLSLLKLLLVFLSPQGLEYLVSRYLIEVAQVGQNALLLIEFSFCLPFLLPFPLGPLHFHQHFPLSLLLFPFPALFCSVGCCSHHYLLIKFMVIVSLRVLLRLLAHEIRVSLLLAVLIHATSPPFRLEGLLLSHLAGVLSVELQLVLQLFFHAHKIEP
jgi:hypothetical protein